MQLEILGFDSFLDLLVVVRMGERSDFLLHDGFLFKGNQLCVPDCSLRLRFIHELHSEGHIGRDCTL